ncbi:MAG TPA: metal ABC transporter ATP-binding protein [Acidimicrobiales bacterium]|nr:metal ABC transporter ATP-binding protein [Acidimicrobiales bacterium]
MPTVSVLEADGVGHSYGSDAVLEHVSLSVAPGEFVALVGPNGSGKSTLLRILLGLLPVQRGVVRLFGTPPDRLRERWRIGYVPQRPALARHLPATVEEVVEAGRLARSGWRRRRLSAADRDEVTHALESVALLDVRRRRVRELSGGQQQRAFIAKALVAQPDLLVLDEPVAGVDADSQRRFRDSLVHLVADHGTAVLLVSHELGAVADDLDRVVVMRSGRVSFDGTPADLAATGVSLGVHAEDLPLWLEAGD